MPESELRRAFFLNVWVLLAEENCRSSAERLTLGVQAYDFGVLCSIECDVLR